MIEIDFTNKKDQAIETTMILNNETKEHLNLLTISGRNENEDGSQNIFLIQQ